MRRHTVAVALAAAWALPLNAGHAVPERRPAELVSCIEERLNAFVEKARAQEAALRVEVRILDEECAETVQIVLWETPEQRVHAKAMVADHLNVDQQIAQARGQQPLLSESSLCDAISLETVSVTRDGEARLPELVAALKKLRIQPVLEPLLILHGLQYEIRIESGISETTFSFHAPGHPRPPKEALHPLDWWSDELRLVLGAQCRWPEEDQSRE